MPSLSEAVTEAAQLFTGQLLQPAAARYDECRRVRPRRRTDPICAG